MFESIDITTKEDMSMISEQLYCSVDEEDDDNDDLVLI